MPSRDVHDSGGPLGPAAAQRADHASAREHVLMKIHSDDFVRATAPSFKIPSARMLADEDEEDRSGGAKNAAAPSNDLVKFQDGYSRSGLPWAEFFSSSEINLVCRADENRGVNAHYA